MSKYYRPIAEVAPPKLIRSTTAQIVGCYRAVPVGVCSRGIQVISSACKYLSGFEGKFH
mgnify:CR=1 FL=1